MPKLVAGRMETMALAVAPALFVFLWSTGWVAARYAAIDSDVLTFLALRFALAFLVFLVIVVASRATLPLRRRDMVHGVVSGILLHPLYVCCLWWAIEHGVSAGISAVLAALQPILTALLAPSLVGEHITAKRWLGIALGFAGIVLVLLPRLLLSFSAAHDDFAWPLFVNVCGMLSVTAGSFYQKRYLQAGDLRTTAMLQYSRRDNRLRVHRLHVRPAALYNFMDQRRDPRLGSARAVGLLDPALPVAHPRGRSVAVGEPDISASPLPSRPSRRGCCSAKRSRWCRSAASSSP